MIFECQDCLTTFHETDQTRSEQRDGKCPSCGSEDLKEIEPAREMEESENTVILWREE
jgi:Zn finger protein HypA/HybF involved in hydrogenase expression